MLPGVLNTSSALCTENYWPIMSNGLTFIQTNNDSDDDGTREIRNWTFYFTSVLMGLYWPKIFGVSDKD